MKTPIKFLALILTLILVMPFAVTAGVTDDTASHEQLARQYEEKALAQDALILEHTQMKLDYAEKLSPSPKGTNQAAIKEMEKHCNSIIQEAQALKAEFLDFAKWHKMRAAEMQGK